MMTEEGSTKTGNFMTPGVGVLVLRCGHVSHIVCTCVHYIFKNLLLYFGGCFRQTQKNSFDNVHIDSYCINRLYCSFPLALLIFIYSMMGLLIWKYEPFWQKVSVESLILRWPLSPLGLFIRKGTIAKTNKCQWRISFGQVRNCREEYQSLMY